jgi:hypothetical protein
LENFWRKLFMALEKCGWRISNTVYRDLFPIPALALASNN